MKIYSGRTEPSYLEKLDPLLVARIAMIWAGTDKPPKSNGGTRITPSSYLLGMVDAFGTANNKQAAQECSFLLDLLHHKTTEL